MAATHLKWDPIPARHATGLPVKVTVQACTAQGGVDTSQSGKLSLLVCKSLCDDTFSRSIHPWIVSTDARMAEGPVCHVVAKPHGEGDPCTRHCLQIKGGVGDAKMDRNWSKGAKRVLGSIRPTRLSFNVQTNSAEHETGVLFLTDANDRVCTVFALREGGMMGIEDELIHFPNDVRTKFCAHRWYCVNMIFDWGSHVFDLVVDGIVVGTRIPFEDSHVTSLGYAYISSSHPSSETLWDRFQCSHDACSPGLELEGPAYLNNGIWQGHISFEAANTQSGSGQSENIFLRALLEGSELTHTPPAQRACEASPAEVTWGARELQVQGQQQHSSRDRLTPPHGRASPPTTANASDRAVLSPGAAAGPEGARPSSAGGGGAEDEEGAGMRAPVARSLFPDAAAGHTGVETGNLSSNSRISKSYAQQIAEATTARLAPFCSGLHGRSDAFDLYELEKEAISQGNNAALTRDTLSLLDDPTVSDLTLMVEGQKIYVHRAILYARSTHFRNMFTSGMRECEERVVRIDDAPYAAFKVMLTYLYMGDAPITPDIAMPVLDLADRYMIYGLKRLCEAVLVKAICLQNLVPILEAANHYSASHLQQVCLDYAVLHFQELVHCEEYMTLDPNIMLLVQRAVAPHVAAGPHLGKGKGACSASKKEANTFCSPGRSTHA